MQMGSGQRKILQLNQSIKELTSAMQVAKNDKEKFFAAAQVKDLQREKATIQLTKERLKAFYGLSTNRFCSQIAIQPMRPSIATIYRREVTDERTEVVLEPCALGGGLNLHPCMVRILAREPKLLQDLDRPRMRKSTLEEFKEMLIRNEPEGHSHSHSHHGHHHHHHHEHEHEESEASDS